MIANQIKELRDWRKTVPDKFKYLKISKKSRNVKFDKLLFNSDFFEQKKLETITDGIIEHNKTEFASAITRQEVEYYIL